MLVLGLSGGLNPLRLPETWPGNYHLPAQEPHVSHDSAAIVLNDGEIIAGAEEERLNRVKHSNHLATLAIRLCLETAGASVRDIDHIAYFLSKTNCQYAIVKHVLQNPRAMLPYNPHILLAQMLTACIGQPVRPEQIKFIEHHHAHAVSAYHVGPFEDALVVTIDGDGDGLSGAVFAGRAGRLTCLNRIPATNSLGHFYSRSISYLGYGRFDEYKVMGLAAYGNPATLSDVAGDLIQLLPNGVFAVRHDFMERLTKFGPPRRADQPFTQRHKDFAAAIQACLEQAVFHLLAHYGSHTGLRNLCLAGGVAHNSTLVGKLMLTGLFDGVFVQPAAHDAGCALGAALAAYQQASGSARVTPISHVYWGRNIGDEDAVGQRLSHWTRFVDIRRADDVAAEAARLIFNGVVLGWVQGRSEFGPRALGNRSILADPRDAATRDRINQIVKMREPYRPFAPAVLEEYADEFFEIPKSAVPAFMTFTVPVRADARAQLQAVTHADGSARIQTVSKQTNPRFWQLIENFRILSNVPVLLNTSFNNDAEPIIDSVDDAVTTLLTTGLTHIVVGDFVVTKRDFDLLELLELALVLPAYVELTHSRRCNDDGAVASDYLISTTDGRDRNHAIDAAMFSLLKQATSALSMKAALSEPLTGAELNHVAAEIVKLWQERLVSLRPVSAYRLPDLG